MKIEVNEIDSRAYGAPVLTIADFDSSADFAAFERAYTEQHRPAYVSCKIPLEQPAAIHALEDAGFRFIECQIRSEVAIRKPHPVEAFPYRFERVESEEQLRDVIEIAARTFVHDRFSIDPQAPPGVSSRRYREYVQRSFTTPGEAVFRLIENESGRTVAFKTHRLTSPAEALLLLGGVDPDCKGAGLGAINAFFEYNHFQRTGVKRAVTHISASNYPIFLLEISRLGFRVTAAFAVLRKVYPRQTANFFPFTSY